MNFPKYKPISSLIILTGMLFSSIALAAPYSHLVNVTGLKNPDVPNIEISPSNLSFPDTYVGQSSYLDITVHNTAVSSSLLDLRTIIQGSAFSSVSNSCGSTGNTITLPGSQSCTVSLAFSPTSENSFIGSITVDTSTPTLSGNSVSLPVFGSGIVPLITATGAWSSSFSSVAPPPTSTGAITLNSSMVTALFLKNTGTSGALTAGFTLSGDTSQYQVTLSKIMSDGSLNTSYVQPCSPAVSVTPTSLSECSAADISTGLVSSYSNLYLSIKYNPTVTGTHSLTITPTSSVAGVILPAPITLSGQSIFDPTGAWSSYYFVNAPISTIPMGQVSVGNNTSSTFFLRNVGTHGALSAGFSISGDTSQFQVTSVSKMMNDGSLNTSFNQACSPAVSITPTTVSECATADVTGGKSAYSNLMVTVRYAPTASGSHSIVLTPTSSVPGTTLPAGLAISGTGVVTDPNFSSVALLTHFDGSLSDQKGNVVSVAGGSSSVLPTITSASKFGTGAAAFNGTTSCAKVPYVAGFNTSSATYTVETWFNPAASSGILVSKDTYGDNYDFGIYLIDSTTIKVMTAGTGVSYSVSVPAIALNTWHHVAVVRNAGTLNIYLDGVRYGAGSTISMTNASVSNITLGCASWNNPNTHFNGLMDDTRWTAGVARYTGATYVVPTAAFPNL